MASIFQRKNGKWTARIRRSGYKAISETFDTHAQAERWAMKTEAAMLMDEYDVNSELKSIPAFAIVKRYIEEVTPEKKSSREETVRLNRALRTFPQLFAVPVKEFTVMSVIEWRDERGKEVSPATVNREWNSLSSVWNHAIKEWQLPIDNVWRLAKRPPSGKPRKKRISDDEIAELKIAFDYDGLVSPCQKKHYIAWAFLFAIETAMRLGEICSLDLSDIDGRIAHLSETKNGDSRDVPLSKEAMRLLSLIKHSENKLIPLNSASASALFRKYRDKAGIVGVNFHDTRHEALSRLAKKIKSPMDLAKISGHKDLKILLNVYYNPTADDLIDLID